MGFMASWEWSSYHHIELSHSAHTTSLGHSLGFWLPKKKKKSFSHRWTIAYLWWCNFKGKNQEIFSTDAWKLTILYVKTYDPETRTTSSPWYLSVKYFRALVLRKKGTEKGVELATGNEPNLCSCFTKAWTTFLEQTLFYKMSSTWKVFFNSMSNKNG